MSKQNKIIILIILLAAFIFFIAGKIDLTTADLGRHIQNGKVILNSGFKNNILTTNFYSYTHPDYPFVNHHWASGVIFFLIEKITGFVGLSFFYIILSIIIFLLFFHITKKGAGFKIAAPLCLLLIPLMAARMEIRPEIFTYFFSAIFFWILWQYKKNNISFKWLFALPILGILWINTHIYFIFGIFFIGLFLLDQLILKNWKKVKKLGLILITTIIACLINPFGPKGFLFPFNIFKEYGYRIIENKSIWFLEKLDIIKNPNFLLAKVVFLLMLISFVWLLIKNRKKFSIILFGLGMVFGLMAMLAIRNFTIFGFFALPIIGINIKNVLPKKVNSAPKNCSWCRVNWFWIAALIIIVFTLFNNYKFLSYHWHRFGLGLMPNNNESAEFFKEKNIKGPILNNYDIGSYLIYHLFSQERIFVDNRPETYPVSFFKEIYIPLQENESVWQEKKEEYNFNAIFFSHRDATPWAQKFLIERIDDPQWAPVFVDQYAIIFLKRNELNQSIIEKYQIPRDRFRVIKK